MSQEVPVAFITYQIIIRVLFSKLTGTYFEQTVPWNNLPPEFKFNFILMRQGLSKQNHAMIGMVHTTSLPIKFR